MIDLNDIRYRYPLVAEHGRQREKVYHRYLLWYYLYKKEHLSLNSVGYLSKYERKKQFDHATIIHGLKEFDALVDTKDVEFYKITKKIGMELLPEIYINLREKLRPKLKKTTDLVNYQDNMIREKLKSMGASVESEYDIVGKIGDETITLAGFTKIIKQLEI